METMGKECVDATSPRGEMGESSSNNGYSHTHHLQDDLGNLKMLADVSVGGHHDIHVVDLLGGAGGSVSVATPIPPDQDYYVTPEMFAKFQAEMLTKLRNEMVAQVWSEMEAEVRHEVESQLRLDDQQLKLVQEKSFVVGSGIEKLEKNVEQMHLDWETGKVNVKEWRLTFRNELNVEEKQMREELEIEEGIRAEEVMALKKELEAEVQGRIEDEQRLLKLIAEERKMVGEREIELERLENELKDENTRHGEVASASMECLAKLTDEMAEMRGKVTELKGKVDLAKAVRGDIDKNPSLPQGKSQSGGEVSQSHGLESIQMENSASSSGYNFRRSTTQTPKNYNDSVELMHGRDRSNLLLCLCGKQCKTGAKLNDHIRYFTNKAGQPTKTKRTYCVCNEKSDGRMIRCENKKKCPKEWFHRSCMGFASQPKEKWYCPQCTQLTTGATVDGTSGQSQEQRSELEESK